MENLWPKFNRTQELTPKAILLEQADAFNSLGLGLRADLSTVFAQAEDDMFAVEDVVDQIHTFRIIAPNLGGFTYTLFRAKHKITSLYPVDIYDNMTGKKYENLYGGKIKDTLKEIFSSNETKKLIESLLAQTTISNF